MCAGVRVFEKLQECVEVLSNVSLACLCVCVCMDAWACVIATSGIWLKGLHLIKSGRCVNKGELVR